MKSLFFAGALAAALCLTSGPARAEVTAVNVVTTGVPAWWTWYGYPANMSYYYGPTTVVAARPAVEVAVPVPAVTVALPAAPAVAAPAVVVEDRPEVAPEDARNTVSIRDDRALVRVKVPADARVWFSGVLTRQKGTDRLFETPSMNPDEAMTYTVKASWRENGREVTRRDTIRLHPGDDITVNFLAKVPLHETRVEELPRP